MNNVAGLLRGPGRKEAGMPAYEIRYNVEYILRVEADSAREAKEIADETPLRLWDSAPSPLEIEDVSDRV